MGVNAFTPTGNTITFTAAVSAPTPVQAASTTLGGNQYRVHNTGNVVVYMGYGNDANAATTMANANVVGSTITLVPSSVEIFSFNANVYFTGVTDSSTAIVHITPGDGV